MGVPGFVGLFREGQWPIECWPFLNDDDWMTGAWMIARGASLKEWHRDNRATQEGSNKS
jgi:hypothetical protein